MDKVPLPRRRRVQVLQPSAPNCSYHQESFRCGLHHSTIKPVLLSVCNQTILSDLQATRRSGSIERSCVIIPSEFSSLVHQIAPTYLEIGRDRTGTPSELGQSPDGHVVQHAHASHVFIDSQIFTRIAKQKQEVS